MTPDATPSPDDPGPLVQAARLFARIRREGEWESAQTHASLVPYLIEESWELADAIADGDRAELRSELGDLLLQVLFHSAIAAEDPSDPFDVDDVATAMLDKLRRRAPYWFEDGPPQMDAEEQDRVWEAAKAAEGRRGVFDGIAWGLPALALGDKVLARCRKAGVPAECVPREIVAPAVMGYGQGDGSEPGEDPSEGSENAHRQAIRRFARRVEAAAQEIGADQGAEAPFAAELWRAALDRPGSSAETAESI
ncbi:MazG family protein [Dietzia sp.]|uniref:MazG family protein n=1 Tax=Dietzia sp. TaxID=1871616 RepID=UPI002FD919D3